MSALFRTHALSKSYRRNGTGVPALSDVSLTITAGEYTAVTGPSGSGKSTFLHLLGGIDQPTAGSVEFEGIDLGTLSDRALTALQLRRIGFIFQRFHLLSVLTARENIELPLAEAGMGRATRRSRARELLAYVGLEHREDHRPPELSGGEMQRVAIARALANRPSVLLADEPTGELDRATGRAILDLFRAMWHDGLTLVVVTHDEHLAAEAGRRITLRDGRVAAGEEP